MKRTVLAVAGLVIAMAPAPLKGVPYVAGDDGQRLLSIIFSGIHDKQVTPDRVRPLYDDLGATQKVLVDLACSSHNAMWEKNHLLMFNASLEWLTKGAVGETKQGVVKLGY